MNHCNECKFFKSCEDAKGNRSACESFESRNKKKQEFRKHSNKQCKIKQAIEDNE